MRKILAALLVLLASTAAVLAQPNAPGCPGPGIPCTAVQAFTPVAGGYTTLSVSGSSSNVALPSAANGLNVGILNTGATVAYVILGDNTATATTSSIPVSPNLPVTLPIGGNTYIAGITASSTTTLSLYVGSGVLSTASGGASGGGGGGGGATSPLTSTNLSSTISVTNTFQSIQVLTSGRKGCIIQNNSSGTNNQWVYFGSIGSATKASAVLLSPGGSVSCNLPAGVLTDQISITGTSGDSFYAAVQ